MEEKNIIRIKKVSPYPLRDFFERNKISQRDIAHALGSERGSVSHWMSGHQKIPQKIEERFRVTALYLCEKRKAFYPLTDKERKFCETGILK